MRRACWIAFFVGLYGFFLTADLCRCEQPGWGDVEFRFVYDGEPPKPKRLRVTRDPDVIGGIPEDESLLVDPESRGIANVVVYLDSAPGAVEIHPDYPDPKTTTAVLTAKDARLDPHVLVMRAGATFEFQNKDPVAHAPRLQTYRNEPFSSVVRPGESRSQVIPRPERLPIHFGGTFHSWIHGFLVVKDHPYVAVSGPDGKCRLKYMPAGEWTFCVWHEKAGYLTEVERNGKTERWEKGRFRMAVSPGANETQQIRLAPTLFEVR